VDGGTCSDVGQSCATQACCTGLLCDAASDPPDTCQYPDAGNFDAGSFDAGGCLALGAACGASEPSCCEGICQPSAEGFDTCQYPDAGAFDAGGSNPGTCSVVGAACGPGEPTCCSGLLCQTDPDPDLGQTCRYPDGGF
jgi:hypothetical protein